MNQQEFLQNTSVAGFRDWLGERLCGKPIHFDIAGRKYLNLPIALAAYSWPRGTQTGLPNPHEGLPYIHPVVPQLDAGSDFAANEKVLQIIQHALREAYAASPADPQRLAGAVAATFRWGGVYTGPGNKGWLWTNYSQLLAILQATVNDHAKGNDTSDVANLRFNSGMTKVYSLLIDDFIIYDSRVAASLAWLVKQWWTVKQDECLPECLRFGCLPANGAAADHRNPDPQVFPNLGANHPYQHYTWNVRANWLLGAALGVAQSNQDCAFQSLREVEAALFQMGYRVV